MKLRVSPCGHFFQHEDGSPFFFLGDTVWMLFNKLTEEDARLFFKDRAEKGFTVIQSVIFRDLFSPNTQNAYGVRPFATDEDMHAVRMNPAWMEYVVKLTNIAAEYGLVMGILPTWGDKWNEHSNSAGPVIMDKNSARSYGRYLSDTLSSCENVIWILGGDSPILSQDHADITRAMAEGIRSGGSNDRLMTFHPPGTGSSGIFHSEPWLDFNVLQTSHSKPNIPGYVYIERLYATPPPKPCMDMEPNYELSPMFIVNKKDHPFVPVFSAYDVRKSLYRTVLAGAAGFTYGCEPIRQLYRTGDQVHIHTHFAMPTWQEALNAPGSSQLKVLKDLLISRKYFSRKPAQELFLPFKNYGAWADTIGTALDFAGQQNTDPASHVRVAKCSDGEYIIAYVPVRQVLSLDTSTLAAKRLAISIYNPETGEKTSSYEVSNTGSYTIVPERDLDTLFIIDRT